MKKKILTAFITALLTIGMLPTIAFADDANTTGAANLTSGYDLIETVTVTNAENASVHSGKFQGATITSEYKNNVNISFKVEFDGAKKPAKSSQPYVIKAKLYKLVNGKTEGDSVATATNNGSTTGVLTEVEASINSVDLEEGTDYVIFYTITDGKGETIVDKKSADEPARTIVHKQNLTTEPGDYLVSLGRVKDSAVAQNKYEYLEGAKLHLEKKNELGTYVAMDKTKYAWTSDNAPKHFTLELGEYKVVEDEAPDGWKKAEDYTFKIDDKFQANTADNGRISFNEIGDSHTNVGYCLDYDKDYPDFNDKYSIADKLTYIKADLNDEVAKRITNKSQLSIDELKTNLLRMTLVGYPNDIEGIGQGLTEDEFYKITQAAIWHLGGDDEGTQTILKDASPAAKDAYYKLINSKYDVPSDVHTNVLVPSNLNYQYLLTTSTVFAHVMSSDIVPVVVPIDEDKKFDDNAPTDELFDFDTEEEPDATDNGDIEENKITDNDDVNEADITDENSDVDGDTDEEGTSVEKEKPSNPEVNPKDSNAKDEQSRGVDTSDSSNIALYGGFMATALIALIAVLIRRRHRSN